MSDADRLAQIKILLGKPFAGDGALFAYGDVSYLVDRLERAEAERDRHRERAVIEAGIVDRVWAALGVTNYPSAGGKSIDELVSGQRARVAKLEGALRWLVNLGHDVGKNGGPPEHGEFEAALTEARAALEKAR